MSTATKSRRRAAGQCINCGDPASKARCPDCAAILRVKSATYRRERGVSLSTRECSNCFAADGHDRRSCPKPVAAVQAPRARALAQPAGVAVHVHADAASPTCPA